MFSGIFGKIVLAQTVLLLALSAGSYFYFRHSQTVIASLTEENAVLQTTVQTQTATIAAQEEAAKRQNAESLRLQQSLVDAESSRRALEQRIRSRNLEAMARANSIGLENKINEEASQLLRDIETLTRPRHQVQTSVQSEELISRQRPSTNPAQSISPQPPPRPPRVYEGSTR